MIGLRVRPSKGRRVPVALAVNVQGWQKPFSIDEAVPHSATSSSIVFPTGPCQPPTPTTSNVL